MKATCDSFCSTSSNVSKNLTLVVDKVSSMIATSPQHFIPFPSPSTPPPPQGFLKALNNFDTLDSTKFLLLGVIVNLIHSQLHSQLHEYVENIWNDFMFIFLLLSFLLLYPLHRTYFLPSTFSHPFHHSYFFFLPLFPHLGTLEDCKVAIGDLPWCVCWWEQQ